MIRGYEEADKVSTGRLVLHKPIDHDQLKQSKKADQKPEEGTKQQKDDSL